MANLIQVVGDDIFYDGQKIAMIKNGPETTWKGKFIDALNDVKSEDEIEQEQNEIEQEQNDACDEVKADTREADYKEFGELLDGCDEIEEAKAALDKLREAM